MFFNSFSLESIYEYFADTLTIDKDSRNILKCSKKTMIFTENCYKISNSTYWLKKALAEQTLEYSSYNNSIVAG